MATAAETKTPVHLWVVGGLSLLWNGLGCIDYLMTETANRTYLARMPADQIAYMHALPGWLTGMWAIGVWGGLAGSILLLMRSRHSVVLFALSFIGAVIGLGYQVFLTDMPLSMRTGLMGMMPWVIVIITVSLLWYSWAEKDKGDLR
jgi:hypothetical protein